MTRYGDTFNNKRNLLFSPRLILYDNFLTQSDKYCSGAYMSVNSLNLCLCVCWILVFMDSRCVLGRVANIKGLPQNGGWWVASKWRPGESRRSAEIQK